jgi:hypothetical protein
MPNASDKVHASKTALYWHTRCHLSSAPPKKPLNTTKTNYVTVAIRRAFGHLPLGGVLNPGAVQTAARTQGPAKPQGLDPSPPVTSTQCDQ